MGHEINSMKEELDKFQNKSETIAEEEEESLNISLK